MNDRQRLMHFCNRSNVGNLKPSNKLPKNSGSRGLKGETIAIARQGWLVDREREREKAGRKLFMAVEKESAATANECHCEHGATCALYGWKKVRGVEEKRGLNWGVARGGVQSGETEGSTVHEP